MKNKTEEIKSRWKKYKNKYNNKNAFTLIELIVVMSVIAILVLLASPRFLNKTQDAHHTKHIANVKTLEDAAERYYMDHGKWPRADVDPYTPEQLASYAERIKDATGEEVSLTEGNYWDIDYDVLSKYAKLPDKGDRANYILRNPTGKIYYLEDLTEEGVARIPDEKSVEYAKGEVIDFTYTGAPQEITLPKGTYKLEVWGAQGGGLNNHQGKGGYASGVVTNSKQKHFYILVGGKGDSADNPGTVSGGYNGGGNGEVGNNKYPAGGGGGATDVRIDSLSLNDRIIVAGAGGGRGDYGFSNQQHYGGWGGGLQGGDGDSAVNNGAKIAGFGGTQTSGGLGYNNGSLGRGGSGRAVNSSAGGGGAGYYGGGGGQYVAGGGGSSYIGGVENGQTIPGNQTMPNPQGGTMVGNSGHGFARITVLEAK